MPDGCLTLLFLPSGHTLPRWWVVGRGVTGQLTHYWVLCAPCKNASSTTQPPPSGGLASLSQWCYNHNTETTMCLPEFPEWNRVADECVVLHIGPLSVKRTGDVFL